MVPTTLFKSVRSSSHEQFEQACQQHCSSCPCSNWPAQPCWSLSTTMFKLASSTTFKPVNRQKQAVRFTCDTWAKNNEIESTVRTNFLKGLLQIAVSCAPCDAEKETSIRPFPRFRCTPEWADWTRKSTVLTKASFSMQFRLTMFWFIIIGEGNKRIIIELFVSIPREYVLSKLKARLC